METISNAIYFSVMKNLSSNVCMVSTYFL